jgi:2-polyprenyl-6-methoxyphenol hydroxylase-like FAD-dependent oxidoreductase
MTDSAVPHNHVVIIGTGFGGIATAIRLRRAGVDEFVLLNMLIARSKSKSLHGRNEEHRRQVWRRPRYESDCK